MSDEMHRESVEPSVRDTVTEEIGRLVGLVRRLERENASLRQELSQRSSLA